MSRSLNLSLTDELRSFVDKNSGEGTTFSTPSEYVRAILREKKERQDAAALRSAVLEGYQDIKEGRFLKYEGSVQDLIDESQRRDQEGW
jgi:antitoxin ParD1/3/4